MYIEIEKKNLIGLLARTQNIVEKRNSMPVLANVLLQLKDKKLKIFATDLEVSITDETEVISGEDGQLAASAKNLFDIIKEFSEGPILITKKGNNWLEIKQNKSVFNIVGISTDEYPIFPSFSTKEFMKINPQIFCEMIEKTIYSVSNDETRYHLNGVYFEKYNLEGKELFKMVATDGHRLSLVSRNIELQAEAPVHNQGVIIPRKGLYEIRKLLEEANDEIEMAIEGPQLIVRHGSTVLMTRLIEGKYPNYQMLIPQNLSRKVLVNRETLLTSLKRVSLLSNQKYKGVTLALSKGKLEISSNNPDLGDAKEEIEIDYKGEDMKIGFNAKYILDVLNSFEDENVDINLNDQLSPGLMRPHNDHNYTCVVMPMRI